MCETAKTDNEEEVGKRCKTERKKKTNTLIYRGKEREYGRLYWTQKVRETMRWKSKTTRDAKEKCKRGRNIKKYMWESKT